MCACARVRACVWGGLCAGWWVRNMFKYGRCIRKTEGILYGTYEGKKWQMLTRSKAAGNIYSGGASGGPQMEEKEAEEAPRVKSWRGKLVASVGHRGSGRDGTFYLSRAAGEAPEGRALCPQSHCRGSSYWGWPSLTWRTFQTQREDTISRVL